MYRKVGIGSAIAILGVGVALGSRSAPVRADATPAWTAYISTAQETVWALDVANDTQVTQITAKAPAGIAITPDGKTAYVTGSTFNVVTPITIATNTPGTPIPVGTNPNGIASPLTGRPRT